MTPGTSGSWGLPPEARITTSGLYASMAAASISLPSCTSTPYFLTWRRRNQMTSRTSSMTEPLTMAASDMEPPRYLPFSQRLTS